MLSASRICVHVRVHIFLRCGVDCYAMAQLHASLLRLMDISRQNLEIARPETCPSEEPTATNCASMRAHAKLLVLSIPPSVLITADEVI